MPLTWRGKSPGCLRRLIRKHLDSGRRKTDLVDMKNRSFFRFQVPPVPKGPLVEVSYQEAEKLLLEKLSDPTEDRTNALRQLALRSLAFPR